MKYLLQDSGLLAERRKIIHGISLTINLNHCSDGPGAFDFVQGDNTSQPQ